MGTTHFNNVSGINGLFVGAKDAEIRVAAATGRLSHLGTALTPSATELNKMTGVTLTTGQLNKATNLTTVLPLGAVSATASFCVFIAPAAGSLNACQLVTKDAIAANDTDYWTITLTDKGATGVGTDTIATKHTQATGGLGFAAYDAWDIGALSATHKVLAAGDVVVLTLTKAASATAFAEAAVMLEFIYS